MPRLVLIGLLSTFAGAATAAEPAGGLRLWNSNWEIHRAESRELQPYDLGYFGSGTSAGGSAVGLRFRSQGPFTFGLRVDPITDLDDLVGPMHDMRVGSAMLTFAIRF